MAAYKPDKHGRDHCPGGEDPIPCFPTGTWALLAIPDGETVATNSLVVVAPYVRAESFGTALSVNGTTGLITFNEEGIYSIHSWAEFDNPGNFVMFEGPVFQAGQDFQDIGNGLHAHNQGAGVSIDSTIRQHSTTIFVADLPQSVNLQVAHMRGSNDDLVNGGLTVVKIASYTP